MSGPDEAPTRAVGGADSQAGGPDVLPSRIGPYAVKGVLARGGMGVVYRVRDPKLGRDVALKMVLGGPWSSEASRQRFLREARLLGELSHPGIVPVHDAGIEGAVPYYTMDLVEGMPLDRFLACGTFSLEEKLRVFAGICEAVHHAHLKGIIHRDLKPANILVTRDRHPVVLDFGLARTEDPSALATRSGEVVGTPAYMAPEQARGLAREIDLRTDVYALGVILYELAAGRRPFQGAEAYALLKAVVEEEPPRPSALARGVAADLEAVILKAMAKEPARRYDTARALGQDLGRFLEGRPVEARPASAGYRFGKWAGRHRELVAAAACLLLLGGWALWRVQRAWRAEAAAGRLAQAREREAVRSLERARLAEREAQDSLSRLREELTGREARAQADRLLSQAESLASSDPARALALAEQALGGDARHARAHRLRGTLLLGQGRPGDALEAVDRALALEPRDAGAWQARAAVLGAQGKAGEALEALSRALALDPGLLEAQMDRGALLRRAGRLEEALRAYGEVLGRDPGFLRAHEARAGVLRERGLPDEALASADRALSLDPSFVPALRLRAALLQETGRLVEAKAAYDRLSGLEARQAGACFDRGLILHAQGRLAEALKAYDEALALDARHAGALHHRGVVLQRQGDLEAAREAYARAAEAAPRNAAARMNLGEVLEALGRPREAAAAYEAALGLDLPPELREGCRARLAALRRSP